MTDQTATRFDARGAGPGGLARLWTPPRVMGLDVARGLAVIGMIAAHTIPFGPFDWGDPTTWGAVANGRSSIVFAIIAGVSIAVMTRTPPADADEARRERLRLAGRGVAIVVIGIALEALGTGIAIILCLYGAVIIAAIPVLRWRRRWLLTLAVGLAAANPLATTFLTPFAGVGSHLLSGTYPLLFWVALMLVGLAIGRSDITRARTATALLGVGALLAVGGYGLGVALQPVAAESMPDIETSMVTGDEVDVSGLECLVSTDGFVQCAPPGGSGGTAEVEHNPWRDIVDRAVSYEPHSGGYLEFVGSGGVAIVVLGACLLVARPWRWVLAPIAALGSMPVTAYTAQVVVLGGTQLLGLSGVLVWAGLTGALMIATTIWAAVRGRGPLERLVARVAAWSALERPGSPA